MSVFGPEGSQCEFSVRPHQLGAFLLCPAQGLLFFPRPKGLGLDSLSRTSPTPTACCLLGSPTPAWPGSGSARRPPSSALPPWPWGTPVCLSQSISKHCCSRLQMCGPQLGPAP